MNRQSFSFVLAATVLVLLSFSVSPLNDELNRIVKTLKAYTNFRPQEKLFVHLDKPIYAAGEDLWFKAYIVNATYHTADSSSRVIYVELLNSRKNLIHRNILYASNGTSHGDFHLSDSLPEGRYVLRAYTNYMKNIGEDFFFTKEIDILNPANKKTETNRKSPLSVHIQFFPEGGNFLHSVENRIAFKVINEMGHGIFAEGEVVDENNIVITSFKSEHDGMGLLKITPAHPNKQYNVRLKIPEGIEGLFPLPEVMQRGYLLRVTEEGENLRVVAYTNAKSFSPDKCIVYLVAQSRGVVTYAVPGEIVNTTLMVKIPKHIFPTGIAQITLFDAATIPQCERLVFINHQDSLQYSFALNKSAYAKRSKVDLDILVTDKSGSPVPGDFSLSVYDKTKVVEPEKNAAKITDYLLLTSDLAGKIEHPGYYLKDIKPETKYHLDLLMMTHGWRRFSWKTILQDTVWSSPNYTERGITVKGTVIKSLGKKPAAGSTIKILTRNGDFVSVISDSLGRFFSDHLLYYDSIDIIVQTDNSKGKQRDLQLQLDPFNASPPLQYTNFPFEAFEAKDFVAQANQQSRFMASKNEKVTMLKEIEITGTKIDEEKRSTVYGTPDQTIKMDRTMQSYSNIFMAIQGRIAGLLISGVPPNLRISMRGGGSPLFLIDGMQADVEMVSTLSPADVESIDVIKGAGAAVYGSQGGNGIVAINTKSGFQYSGVIVGIHKLRYPGLYKAREFYVPKYDAAADSNDFPDKRINLYWNPSVKTDSTGKAHVSFYTSDITSTYKIVLEGISNDGVPGSGSYQFKTN